MISTSSLQQQKPLRFFARITGISPGIFYLSSSTFQRQIAVIGAGMLFTASFSGILLALSIHYFYQHILATLGGFCLSFVFTLLLDRKLICATLPLGFLGQLSRLLLIVAWIILHATMIETALFTDDLQVHLNEQLKPQKASIQNSFHARIEGLQVRRDSITQAISASEQRLLSVHDAAEMEAH